jgi:uncharacterized membrane protein AbrB (regulator of aidB expression)
VDLCICVHTYAHACMHTCTLLHVCMHILCVENGNTMTKTDYSTLNMHMFSAVKTFILFYIFIVIYKFFFHHVNLKCEEIPDHISFLIMLYMKPV